MSRFIVSILIVFAYGCYAAGAAAVAESDSQKSAWEKWLSLEAVGIDANNPPAGWSAEKSHELMLSEFLKKQKRDFFHVMREEFLYMSPGEEFMHLYPGENLNREYHAAAVATKHLWTRLTTMRQVSDIILTSLTKATDVVDQERTFQRSMPVLFDSIEESMKKDAALYAQYSTLKEEAKNRMSATAAKPNILCYELPNKLEDTIRVVSTALNKPSKKMFLMVLSFVNETQKDTCTSEENFALARAVLELAKTSEKAAAVQKTFDEAITEAAQSLPDVNPADFVAYRRHDTSSTLNTLMMKTIAEKFGKNSALGADVEAMKKKVTGFEN